MKKAVIWQIAVTAITLAVYFIVLYFTGDKKIAALVTVMATLTILILAIMRVVFKNISSTEGVVISCITATTASFVASGIVNATSDIVDIFFALIVTLVVLAAASIVVASNRLGISKKRAILLYGTQFIVISTVMLI